MPGSFGIFNPKGVVASKGAGCLCGDRWGLWHQKQVCRACINNYIPQYTVGCNYYSMPYIPALAGCVCIVMDVDIRVRSRPIGHGLLITSYSILYLVNPHIHASAPKSSNVNCWVQRGPPQTEETRSVKGVQHKYLSLPMMLFDLWRWKGQIWNG